MKKNNRKRLKSLPRSRQGWVLLHPMFPMAISEYRQLVKLEFGVKLKSGGRVIVRMRRDLDHPGETARRTLMKGYEKIARRYREKTLSYYKAHLQ